jgi:uncharacterized protein (DUF362 family)/Pyruvate/2-oxoacid:ferredoxin oxidoreductase delta subunit
MNTNMEQKHRVSIVPCSSYDRIEVERAWHVAIKAIGGISQFITPNSKVLVKPNLLSGVTPEKCVTTHPEIVRAVVKDLVDLGCQVVIGDSPGTGIINNPSNIKRIYENAGISQIAQELGAQLYTDIQEDTAVFPQGRTRQRFPLIKAAMEVDHIVVISKAKTHSFMYLSGAIKNLFGLIFGLQKSVFHSIYKDQESFASMLVDLNQLVKPSLQVMDGVMAMEGDGPMAGNPKKIGAILCSKEAVGIDALLCRLMDFDPLRVPVIKCAIDVGWIDPGLENLEVVGEWKTFIKKDFVKPATYSGNHPSKYLRRFNNYLLQTFGGVYSLHPVVHPKLCIKCGKCIRSCPVNVISMQKGRIKFNRNTCIHCFCCHEMCLSGAISLQRNIWGKALAKILK